MTSKSWQKTFFSPAVLALTLSLLLLFAPQAVNAQELPTEEQELSILSGEEMTAREQGTVADAQTEAADILSQTEFRDDGVARSRNWFANAAQAVGEAIAEWLRNLFGNREIDTNAGNGNFGILALPWLGPTMWVVVIVAILAFVIWAATKFNWGAAARLRKKKVGGLMDEDEPERTADEWLVQADKLAADGEFRKAVRCLYIACLVRIDEAGIARLIRAETNWEHLHRIEASPKKPTDLDFRKPTQRFDTIWYGFRTQGQPDVDEFRAFYVDLCQKLQIQNAA